MQTIKNNGSSSIELFFASAGDAANCPANTGTINSHFATVQILDNPPVECANNDEFELTQQRQERHSATEKNFRGTHNPRHLRAIAALLRRPMPRESLDKEAGCSNAPELVAELRRRGLEVPCKRINFIDRDGRVCRPGIFHLTDADRRKVNRWMAARQKGFLDLRLACFLIMVALSFLIVPVCS